MMNHYWNSILFLILSIITIIRGEICPSELNDAINNVLINCDSCQRSSWGIRVDQITPSSPSPSLPLVTLNDQKYLTPASNNKILTTSVSFFELGVNFSVTTPVYLTGEGDLCLVGQGDPTITLSDLQNLADQIYANGLSKVRNVLVDDSYYEGYPLPANWEWSDITQYWGAQPTPLVLDENTFTLLLYPSSSVGELIYANFSYASDADWIQLVITATTSEANVSANIDVDIEPESPFILYVSGTLPVGSDVNEVVLASIAPAFRFAYLLADSLTQSQITMTGNISVTPCGNDNNNLQLIGSLTSPSIVDMLNWTLQTSDNLFAETFLRHLGKTIADDNTTQTTSELGLQVVESTLVTKFGLDDESFSQDDGSGLSRHNLLTPQALVQVISYVYSQDEGPLYLSFFPTAGETGTLSDRFINTTAQGILHAKTGTLGGVNSLSGFVDHQDEDHPVLIFSIIVNNAAESSIPPIDQIGVLLSSVKNC